MKRKRWAAQIWLNNAPALQAYLSETKFNAKASKQAAALLKRPRDVFIVAGMVVYARRATILTTLSLCTQASVGSGG